MSFRDWFNEHLTDYAEDICNHGCDGGFPHITYTNECCNVYDKYATEIWDMAVEDAIDFGNKNVAEFISSFNRSDMLEDWNMFRNLMLWYACEKIAREIIDELENQEE